MNIVVTGSIAYDYLMSFPGKFTEHFLPEHFSRVSLSFLVDSMDKRRGGCAPNIAYTLALLGERPRLMATAGQDFGDYRRWLEAAGIDLEVFYKLISAGGANSAMFQMIVPKALKGDYTGLLFTLGNAKKDIGYYQQMVASAPLAAFMGSALFQLLVQANALGLGEKFVPSLIEAYGKLNGMQVVKS